MPETTTLLAMFEDVEPASEGVEKLQQLGVHNKDMNVISGIPIKHTILGRPAAITYVSRIGMMGAIMGMFLGLFFIYGVKALRATSPFSIERPFKAERSPTKTEVRKVSLPLTSE